MNFKIQYKILMLMLLWAAGMGFGKVALVKSKFTSNYWYALIPADDEGDYYYRIGFGTPMSTYDYRSYITITDMTFGRLRDGNQASTLDPDGTSNLTDFGFGSATIGEDTVPWDKGVFGSTTIDKGQYAYMSENGDGNTRYLVYDPPDTHNVIHVIVYFAGTEAQAGCLFMWSDGTTTDLAMTDLGSTRTAGIRELIVLNGTAAGSRKLKIRPASGVYISVVGVRSWDTTTKGILTGAGADLDDCLITQYVSSGTEGRLCWVTTANSAGHPYNFPIGDIATTGEVYEWGFQWDSGGADYLTSGGNQHIFPTGSYPYRMASAYTDDLVGPELIVDGVSKGGVFNDNRYKGRHTGASNAASLTDALQNWTVDSLIGLTIYNRTDGSSAAITDNDATTVTAALGGGTDNDFDTNDNYYIAADPVGNVRGTAYTGDRIVIRSDGTLDHDSATDPLADWYFVIDDTGLTIGCSVMWQSDIAFAETMTMYPIMLPFSAVLDSGATIRFPLSSTASSIPAENTTYENKGPVAEIRYRNMNLRMLSFNPVSTWSYIEATSKLYPRVLDSISGYPTPASGDFLSLGGKFEVRRVDSGGSETWQEIQNADHGFLGGGNWLGN